MKKMKIKEIFKETAHRNCELPKNAYSFYQEWNRALFFHWKVDKQELQKFLPESLEIDLFNNEAYISLVAFTMEKIRPRCLPAFSPISNFNEINLRTYVVKDGITGVCFLNIEAGKILSVALSKMLSGLPYEHAEMNRNNLDNFQSIFHKKGFSFNVTYDVGAPIEDKTDLDEFLTERYSLFIDIGDDLFRYDIHHIPWPLNKLKLYTLETNYILGAINLNEIPIKVHYSSGVQVIAWNRIKV